MATYPYIIFQPPTALTGYNRTLPSTSQPPHIPATFLEAMSVREEVFVKEQNIPLSLEADSDDSRSCHWVAYDRLTPSSAPEPVGTIRLVPFPHSAHPEPGSDWDVPDVDEDDGNGATAPWIIDRSTSLHDGVEPYVKLGRWAVRKEFRGRGIADLLAREALRWASENPEFFNAVGAKDEQGVPLGNERVVWRGLVCVHAQAYLQGAWKKYGFIVDDKMGTWSEVGIPHFGMFQRLEVVKREPWVRLKCGGVNRHRGEIEEDC